MLFRTPPATSAAERHEMNNHWLASAFVLAVMVGVVAFSLKLALPEW
jgi:hypothetical protein